MLASPWRSPRLAAVHQTVVDAYAGQHAGGISRREVQSVGLCLMTLCLFVEDGVDPAQGPALHKQTVARRPDFDRLAPPDQRGLLTVVAVLSAHDTKKHRRLVRKWDRQVWQSWTPHHATIRAWNTQALT